MCFYVYVWCLIDDLNGFYHIIVRTLHILLAHLLHMCNALFRVQPSYINFQQEMKFSHIKDTYAWYLQ